MENNLQTPHQQETSIQVQVNLNRIIGITYPHHSLLKQMDWMWNPNDKCWEKDEPLLENEREKIIKLGFPIL